MRLLSSLLSDFLDKLLRRDSKYRGDLVNCSEVFRAMPLTGEFGFVSFVKSLTFTGSLLVNRLVLELM